MTLLERNQYIHWSRCHMSSEVVSDVFWTHCDSVKLLNAFHIVLLMDNTYKTNKYKLSLLEIIGVTSTGLTFSIAFVLLSNEHENNFVWTLQKLKGLFVTVDHPEVIVCDRDLTLMNAISIVFPKVHNFLCRFHINNLLCLSTTTKSNKLNIKKQFEMSYGTTHCITSIRIRMQVTKWAVPQYIWRPPNVLRNHPFRDLHTIYKSRNGWVRNKLGGVQTYCETAHSVTCIRARIDVAEWVVPQQKLLAPVGCYDDLMKPTKWSSRP